MYFKQFLSCFLMFNSPLSWKCIKYLISWSYLCSYFQHLGLVEDGDAFPDHSIWSLHSLHVGDELYRPRDWSGGEWNSWQHNSICFFFYLAYKFMLKLDWCKVRSCINNIATMYNYIYIRVVLKKTFSKITAARF